MVQDDEPLLHLDRGARGSERVVFMGDRQAENSGDRVPDELLDPSAVALDRRPHLIEVAREDGTEHLWVVLLSQGGRDPTRSQKSAVMILRTS